MRRFFSVFSWYSVLLWCALPVLAEIAQDWGEALTPAQQKLAEADYAAARPLFEQQARSGNGLAQFTLGLFYQLGWGVTPSPAQSCAWFKLAAQQHVPAAQQQLGRCYLADHFNSGEQTLAYSWFERAQQAGLLGALCDMGKMHADGQFVEPDRNKALQMCSAAAHAGVLEAQLQLAKWLMGGDIVEQDLAQAVNWLTLAANAGDAEAAFYLARFYDNGAILPQDATLALQWYEQAARRGYSAAYLPAAALSWDYFQRHADSPAETHLAKAYVWAKAAQFTAAAETDMAKTADLLLRQILTVIPQKWQHELNDKVNSHLARSSTVPAG